MSAEAVHEHDLMDALRTVTKAAADRAGIPLRCWSPCPLRPKNMSRKCYAVAINPSSLANPYGVVKQNGTGGYSGDKSRLDDPSPDGAEKPSFAEYEAALQTELERHGVDECVQLGRRFEPAGNSRRWIITLRGWKDLPADEIQSLRQEADDA